MDGEDCTAVAPFEQPFERLRLALHPVDRAGLLAFFIDGEDQTAVQQLLVQLDRRRRQEDHHRAFDAVLVRDMTARFRVFAGRGDGQHALGLQQLQRVGRRVRTLLFDDGEHLVLEVGLAHVEERLPGHGGVLHPMLLGQERQNRLHQ
jgi:hypothetical protein